TLLAWCFLTLGIAMGSYWAYYTLGWGGFWFWDPVENASLLPWLAGTALLHSAAVMEKRDALKVWTVLLAILAFSLSLLGTFLVRSGVLTSVHAFASDPRRGLFILAILVVFIGGALFLFMLRASSLKQGGLFAPISREGALVVNNLLLTASCAAVLVGTLYPLLLESINGDKISVGAPFFNLTFGPLFAPVLILAPFGQLLAWKRGDLLAAAQRLFFAAGCGLAAMAVFAAVNGAPVVAFIGSGVAVYLIIGSFVEIFGRVFPSGLGATKNAFARARGLPRSAWGTAFAHAGLGVTLLGLAATGWGVEKIVAMKQGDIYDVGPYQLEIVALTTDQGPNYSETTAHMTVRRDGQTVALIAPSKRFFSTRRMATAQAGIVTLHFGQVYVSIAEPNAQGLIDARLYWKPLVSLIWIGALIMAFGGTLSLSDRRLRVGVARRAARIPASAQTAG
ncbi:heme lyase CcmF/NrfE family subunit, partial [Rhodoblastus sp.]|uniref:heme lyase CcmF/NrfE family subunit n=1 Tax=Rhodoblastus sp. TaxID=1962975 RepID=UPI002613A09A